jgi:predicted secreted protein
VKRVLGICLLLILAQPAFSGDIATFQNLGFSEDGKYFLFGQYGVVEESLKLYAELYTVVVRSNRFTPDGVKKEVYSEELEPGQNGIGALFTLFRESSPLEYDINHMKTGRLLYILVNGDEPKANLSFRDFAAGRAYKIDLLQSASGSGDTVSSSFHINMTLTEKSGHGKNFTIGLPTFRRAGVKQYKIRQILLSPSSKSLVFIIEKTEQTETGVNIRYMVETVFIG